jgi:hypothetical protein
MTLWWMNIVYGIPTLALFYFARSTASHWDSLFLVYGLCFFMLPKISPLNFIFGLSGAAVLSFIYIYISAYRLPFQEWLLSNVLLIVLISLFCYMSYSSEKISRERWLLKDILKQERINFRIISSSIQDDLSRTVNDERSFPLDVHYISQQSSNTISTMTPHNQFYYYVSTQQRNALHYASQTLKKVLGKKFPQFLNKNKDKSEDSLEHSAITEVPYIDNSNNIINNDIINTTSNNMIINNDNNNDDEYIESLKNHHFNSNHYKQPNNMKIRLELFYKGMFAWCLCYAMGYAFDIEEVNKSAAFALLMHSMGFSAFLMVFTGIKSKNIFKYY